MNFDLLKSELESLGYSAIGKPYRVTDGDPEESSWVVHCMRGDVVCTAMVSTFMEQVHWGVYELKTGGRLE